MKKEPDRRGQSRLLTHSPQSDKGGLLKAGAFSLMLHIAFLVIFSLSLKSTMSKMGPSVYRVTLRPLLGDGLPKGGSGLPRSAGSSASSVEKLKPAEKPRREESKKGIVLPPTKKQKSQEALTRKETKSQETLTKKETVEGLKRSSKKGEKLEREKSSGSSLREALEEIDKKVALDKIRKRLARREELEKSATSSSQGSTVSSPGNLTGSGSGAGTGTGSGTGTGTGGSPTGSPWGSAFGGSSALQSKLDEYYSTIWEKIKREWVLPGDIPKGKAGLETVIVIVIERDGKIQKSSFEKRSGNALYDQTAMRAIKKADPLPPIPKEFSDNTFEIGIRFLPE